MVLSNHSVLTIAAQNLEMLMYHNERLQIKHMNNNVILTEAYWQGVYGADGVSGFVLILTVALFHDCQDTIDDDSLNAWIKFVFKR